MYGMTYLLSFQVSTLSFTAEGLYEMRSKQERNTTTLGILYVPNVTWLDAFSPREGNTTEV